MAGTGYIVKTDKGDRGPFSTAQVRDLAAQGKLQPGTRLRDAAHGHSVTVAEVLDGRAKIKAMAVSTADLAIDEVPGKDLIEPAPAPVENPSGRHKRSSDRHGSSRRSPSSGRRGSDSSGPHRTQRVTRKRGMPVGLILAVAILLIGGGVLAYIVMRPTTKASTKATSPATVPAAPTRP